MTSRKTDPKTTKSALAKRWEAPPLRILSRGVRHGIREVGSRVAGQCPSDKELGRIRIGIAATATDCERAEAGTVKTVAPDLQLFSYTEAIPVSLRFEFRETGVPLI